MFSIFKNEQHPFETETSPDTDQPVFKHLIGFGTILPEHHAIITAAHLVEGQMDTLLFVTGIHDPSMEMNQTPFVGKRVAYAKGELGIAFIQVMGEFQSSNVFLCGQYVSKESPIFTIGSSMNIVDGNIVKIDKSKIIANYRNSVPGAPVFNSNFELIGVDVSQSSDRLSQFVPIHCIFEEINK